MRRWMGEWWRESAETKPSLNVVRCVHCNIDAGVKVSRWTACVLETDRFWLWVESSFCSVSHPDILKFLTSLLIGSGA